MNTKKRIYIYTIIMSIVFIAHLCYYGAMLYRQFYGTIPVTSYDSTHSMMVYYNPKAIILMNLILFIVGFLPMLIYRHRNLKKKINNKIVC